MLQQRLYPIAVEDIRRVHYFRFENQTLCIYEQMALCPFTSFLPESYPRSPPTTPVVFTDCESTMAALGWVFRLMCGRAGALAERAAFSFSQVPSLGAKS